MTARGQTAIGTVASADLWPDAAASVLSFYLDAKSAVLEAGFEWEVWWQETRDWDAVEESEFLAEGAWVILNSGFRESVVRRLFPAISSAFCNWVSARSIHQRRRECREAALQIFGNQRKVDSILRLAELVTVEGFPKLKARLGSGGPSGLTTLPGVGPVTAFHLAKNLGIDVAKPDRHLSRLSARFGFPCVQSFCGMIAQHVGDSVAVVDVIMWRFSTLPESVVIAERLSPPN